MLSVVVLVDVHPLYRFEQLLLKVLVRSSYYVPASGHVFPFHTHSVDKVVFNVVQKDCLVILCL
jgi:hypothetical protein